MNRSDVKSNEEWFFWLYCEELIKNGYLLRAGYESSTYTLTEKVVLPYRVQGKSKVLEKEEHILHGSSITADFTLYWTSKAKNIFYYKPESIIKSKIKEIPFRVSNSMQPISQVEVKPIWEGNTSSSISFPYKQKQLYKDLGIYIQKIKPFDLSKSCLFSQTFTPEKVHPETIYKKGTNKGLSRIKYKSRTLNEFVTYMEELNGI